MQARTVRLFGVDDVIVPTEYSCSTVKRSTVFMNFASSKNLCPVCSVQDNRPIPVVVDGVYASVLVIIAVVGDNPCALACSCLNHSDFTSAMKVEGILPLHN